MVGCEYWNQEIWCTIKGQNGASISALRGRDDCGGKEDMVGREGGVTGLCKVDFGWLVRDCTTMLADCLTCSEILVPRPSKAD